MTMIACTINNGYPIIHSDILISGHQRPETFYVPSLTRNLMEIMPEEKSFHPIALKRKVTRLSDTACIAFSGNTFYAERFLEDLKSHGRMEGGFTKNSLKDFIEKYDSNELDTKVGYFIVLMEDTQEGLIPWVLYNNGCQVTEDEVFGKMFLLGSGSNDFKKAIREIQWPLTTMPSSPSEAVQLNMALITSFLSNERVDHRGFHHFWGAGIETLYFDGASFIYLEPISFVYNHWIKGPEDTFGHPIPTKVSNYQYIDGFLFIVDVVASNWKKIEDKDTIVFELSDFSSGLFVVSAFDDKRDIDASIFINRISFVSAFVGMGFIIIDGNKTFGPSGFYGSQDVRVEYQHQISLKIEINRKVYERVQQAIEYTWPAKP